MEAIIFSRDRPLQLECLLRSIKENCDIFSNISVLYTTDKFRDGYELLKCLYSDVYWCDEVDFKTDFLELVELSKYRVALFVDDDIVFRKVDKTELYNLLDEVSIASLRLGNNVTKKQHFSYGASLDGNIFDRLVLLQLKRDRFTNPNQLESKLIKYCKHLTMGWFNESKLIGIPANRVSETSGCTFKGWSVEKLYKKFMSGHVIDYKSMNLDCNNVHKNEPYAYKLADSH